MGALETKKQFMFSGYSLDRCADTATEGGSHVAQLEFPLSEGEGSRIPRPSGQAEKPCYKTSPATWLSQVDNKWERVLYLAGTDWKNNALPEEAKALLANGDDLEKMARERKWICFTSLAEDWGM